MHDDRIPSLDGLRAISILLVLYGHMIGTRHFPSLDPHLWIGDLASLGVSVFFIISGFLITLLLVGEERKYGTISLKQFYIRRSLRIFPAFYAFLAFVMLAAWLGWLDLSATDVASAATYTVNYYPDRSWNIGHLWSLSVEEQFYLLWPVAFLLLRSHHAIIVSLAMVLLAPVVRIAMRLQFAPGSPWRDLEIFPAVADSIAIGSAMALMRPWLLQQRLYLQLTASHWLWLTLPLILLINRYAGYSLVDAGLSPLKLLCIVLLIEASTRHIDSPVGRLLNTPPVIFIGVLSYSLYLWQQPFLNRNSDAWFAAFPQNILLAFIAALASYFLIEKPILGLRQRLRAKRSA